MYFHKSLFTEQRSERWLSIFTVKHQRFLLQDPNQTKNQTQGTRPGNSFIKKKPKVPSVQKLQKCFKHQRSINIIKTGSWRSEESSRFSVLRVHKEEEPGPCESTRSPRLVVNWQKHQEETRTERRKSPIKRPLSEQSKVLQPKPAGPPGTGSSSKPQKLLWGTENKRTILWERNLWLRTPKTSKPVGIILELALATLALAALK